eukprot:CAMPEP_0172408730 /NCGR_PEP_ID=MMETSP1061-20121228/76006_1 /TAXON_ID=37318 /ORGANISM="Pseudo-nitzschia pungens, Strain cf. pungens" /LENGTH=38 /DNA_ID= /DNA_START= /DNA_END= /DNA_ORIENTATION=
MSTEFDEPQLVEGTFACYSKLYDLVVFDTLDDANCLIE